MIYGTSCSARCRGLALAALLGCVLLCLAGAYCGFIADASSGWSLGTRSRPGSDRWKLAVHLGGMWLACVLPGMSCLANKRYSRFRVVYLCFGYVCWLVASECLLIVPRAGVAARILWIVVTSLAVWVVPIMYEKYKVRESSCR
jgi:hypothetical protein